MYIYETTNLINGFRYVGKSSKEFNPRYLGSGKILIRAIKKYGRENFSVKLIEVCGSESHLNEREIYWINEYKKTRDCYNISEGGTGGWVTKFYTEDQLTEYKKKLSDSRKGRVVSSETRKKISDKNKGRILGDRAAIGKKVSNLWKDPSSVFNSIDYRRKISAAKKGRVCSDESRRKISLSRIGGKNPVAVKIIVDETVFDTIRECALKYNISGTAVSKRCRSKNFDNWNFFNNNQ